MSSEEQEDLVLENRNLVTRVVRSAMRHYGLPEDMRDELSGAGLLALVEAAGRYDPNQGTLFASFARWRVHGEIVDVLRRGRSATELTPDSIDEVSSDAPNPEQRAIAAEELDQVRERMKGLNQRACKLLQARYVQGASLTKVAEQLGLSKSYVSRLHRRALKVLRENEQEMEP